MKNIRLIALASAAKSLAVAERTVQRLCSAGKIPAYKIGRAWRIDEAELARWLQEQRTGWRHRNVNLSGPEGIAPSSPVEGSAGRLKQMLKMKPAEIAEHSKQKRTE